MKIKKVFCRHHYKKLSEWEGLDDGGKKHLLQCVKCGKFKIVEKLPKPLLNGQIWIR